MKTAAYLACDLGAESGRVMLGTLAERRLTLEEIDRFPTGPLEIDGSLRWDIPRFFEKIKHGLRQAAQGSTIRSVSTDSWGVDYVLLRGGELVSLPHHYRDRRTEGGFARAFALVPKEEIFARTGIQFMEINTLYQLHAEALARPEALKAAERLLTIGDYFNYLFSGRAVIEESLASTTQLYDPSTRQWAWPLIERLGIPRHLFSEVVPTGTVLGTLQPGVLEGDSKEIQVVATCSHDTGAAVAAVPAQEGEDWAYLSSGTWSLLGIERAKPIMSEAALRENFTNEIGYGGSIRFLKNIAGLWILQECRRAWLAEGSDHSYASLCREAGSAAPLRSLIHPASARFIKPGGMPEKIASYCRATGQAAPETPGEFTRCILESLALLYAATLERLEAVSGSRVVRLHIVGGGSRNELLNQWTADALGRPVAAGPAEATAIGNLLLQALALGDLGASATLADLRGVVRASFPIVTTIPHPAEAKNWAEARKRFKNLPLLD